MTTSQLIDILSNHEALLAQDLKRALELHSARGGLLVECLIQEALLDEEEIFFLFSRRIGVPAIPEERLLHLALSPDIRRRVPRSFALKNILIPLDLDERAGRLSIAAFDPTDPNILEELRKNSRVAEIKPYLARRSVILGAIEANYQYEDNGWSIEGLEELPRRKKKQDPTEPKVEIDPALAKEIAAYEGKQQVVEPAASHTKPVERQRKISQTEPKRRKYVGELERAQRIIVPSPIEVRGRSLLRQGAALHRGEREPSEKAPVNGGTADQAIQVQSGGEKETIQPSKAAARTKKTATPQKKAEVPAKEMLSPEALVQDVPTPEPSALSLGENKKSMPAKIKDADTDPFAMADMFDKKTAKTKGSAVLLKTDLEQEKDAEEAGFLGIKTEKTTYPPAGAGGEASFTQDTQKRGLRRHERLSRRTDRHPVIERGHEDTNEEKDRLDFSSMEPILEDKEHAYESGTKRGRVDPIIEHDTNELKTKVEPMPSTAGPSEGDLENEITQVVLSSNLRRGKTETEETLSTLISIHQMENFESLFRELLVSVGILAAMLEERIDPTRQYQEYGYLSRLIARELGMDEFAVARVALAAHLYGLDMALRCEVSESAYLDVTTVFSNQPTAPGGLGPSLRALGAKALEYSEESGEEPLGLRIIRLVADFLELRAETEGSSSEIETLAQLLRTGGAEPNLVDALVRAIESSESARIKVYKDKTQAESS